MKRFDHALIIGGSISGLLTARVLSDHFSRVTVIDRDALSVAPVARDGVPQARHLHALLMRGLQCFEELLPGLTAELQAAGGIMLEQGRDFRVLFRLGW